MALRTALDQSKVVTFAALVALGWALMNIVHTLQTMTGLWGGAEAAHGAYVGQTATAGIIGALVMAGLAGLLVYLVADLGEYEPSPTTFPPEGE